MEGDAAARESHDASTPDRRPVTAPGATRSDPRSKRQRIEESDVDEDNRRRISAIGGPRTRTPKSIRRINCPSRWPKESYRAYVQSYTDDSEKVAPDDSSQKENLSVASYTETEIHPGFVVRDRRFGRSTKSRSSKRDPNWEPQNEIEEAVRDLLKYDHLPPPELQPVIIQHVKHESVQAIVNRDYDRAAQLEAVYHLVNEGLEWQANEQYKIDQKEVLDEKIQDAKARLEHEERKWEKIFTEFYTQQERERNELLDAHDEELAEFEEKWGAEEMMKKYTKPTRDLIDLRKREKCMALMKHFEDAKLYCQQADELEAGLAAEAEGRATLALVKEHDLMMERQKREIECFDQHEKRIELFLQTERNRSIVPITKQIEQLENRKNQGAPTNKKPKPAGAPTYVATTRTRSCRSASAIPRRSEETTRCLSEYKNRDEIPRLAVRRLNVKKILVENKRPSSVTRPRRTARSNGLY